MADLKTEKGEVLCPKHVFFLVDQDMVLSHRAKLQLSINFFRVKAISTGLLSLNQKSALIDLTESCLTHLFR